MSSHSPLRAPMWGLLLIVLLLGIGGGATAARMVSGAQIKNGTVTGKDVKNRSLKVKDISRSSVARLRGQDGADGASAFEPPPSGTVLSGGGITSGLADSANDTVYGFVQLPVTLAAPLDDSGAGRNLYGGPDAQFAAVDESATRCAGSSTAPSATAGTLCVYIVDADRTIDMQTKLKAGSGFLADGAERSGFTVSTLSASAGVVLLRYVWTYRAP